MYIRYFLTGCCLLALQTLSAQQGSVFQNGFARIEEQENSWYIDTSGKKAFEQIIAAFHPVRTTPPDNGGHSLVVPDEQAGMLLVKNNGKTGMVNQQGNWILPAEYDTIELQWKTLLVLRKEGKMAYADTYGKLLLPLEFEDAGILDDDHFDVKTGGKWGIYSVPEKKLIIPAMYDGFDYCGGCGRKGDYLFAEKGGKWGIVDFSNKVLLPFEYTHEHSFMRSDNWVLALKKNGQELVINLDLKKEYAAPEYSDMSVIGNGLLKARKNGLYGLIDAEGKVVADFRYDDIYEDESNGGAYLKITEKGKTGILREDGKIMLPTVYEGDITAYADCFIVPMNGNYQLVDTTGKQLLAKTYSEITPLGTAFDSKESIPLFKLKQKALYGFYNPVNRKTVEPAFFDIDRTPVTSQASDLLEVTYQEQTGLYNAAGEQVLPVIYQKLEAITPGFVLVHKGNGTGIYDIKNRRMLIPPVYYNISNADADSSLWVVTKRNPAGQYSEVYYNRKGMVVPGPKGKTVAAEKKPQLLEKKTADGETVYGYTNSAGKIVVAPAYERLLVEKNGRGFLAQKEGKFIILNAAGLPVGQQVFEDIVLEEMPRYGSPDVQYSFPLLCRVNDTYRYLTADGQLLPLEVNGIVAFSPYGAYGIPAL